MTYPLIDPVQMILQQVLVFGLSARAATSFRHSEHLADLGEGKAQETGTVNKAQSANICRRVKPMVAGVRTAVGAARFRNEADLLVVADRLD